ncbi:hypothetical protein ACFOVU_17005 [Nocardiopsis sediminis]|uniref:SMI1/KNR4 family protein n=1 Tax=Nocardiopsis sediminis TaxID=1778267 RepID=A0ABV8FSL9_9ACTN
MTDAFSPMPELNLLKEFYDTHDDFFANGFEMYNYGAEHVEGLINFAQANGSGSTYDIWRKDDRADLATLPVVAMGDEGGVHLVARDFREFLRLLASLPTDHEPDIDWGSFGLRGGDDDDDDEPVDNRLYLAWLEQMFGLTPADDWAEIVDAAEAELAREWAVWIHPRIPDAVWSPVHELNLLARFDNLVYGGFANGFWLLDAYGERGKVDNPGLTGDLAPFASTNERDTYYAVWRCDDRADPAELPVVALGATAGVGVVARNMREFLQLIAGLTDADIRCDAAGVDLRACEPAPNRGKLVSWLEETCGLRPAEDPAAVIAAAQAELGEGPMARPVQG